MNNYPRWKFHKEQGAKIVNNPAEEHALGSGWLEVHQAQNLVDVSKAQANFMAQLAKPKEVVKAAESLEAPKAEVKAPIESKAEPKESFLKRKVRRGGIGA